MCRGHAHRPSKLQRGCVSTISGLERHRRTRLARLHRSLTRDPQASWYCRYSRTASLPAAGAVAALRRSGAKKSLRSARATLQRRLGSKRCTDLLGHMPHGVGRSEVVHVHPVGGAASQLTEAQVAAIPPEDMCELCRGCQ